MSESKELRVLAYALKRFMSSGYSAVSMDEIARGCGISKATLYMLFPSKEALMMASIRFIAAQMDGKVSAVISDSALPLAERMDRFFAPVAVFLSRINPSALDDIRRSMPEAYHHIDQTRRAMVLKYVGSLIDEGQAAGLVRPDADKRVIAHMIIGIAGHIIDPDILLEFGQTADRIMDAVKTVIVRGVMTEEGLKQLNHNE